MSLRSAFRVYSEHPKWFYHSINPEKMWSAAFVLELWGAFARAMNKHVLFYSVVKPLIPIKFMIIMSYLLFMRKEVTTNVLKRLSARVFQTGTTAGSCLLFYLALVTEFRL